MHGGADGGGDSRVGGWGATGRWGAIVGGSAVGGGGGGLQPLRTAVHTISIRLQTV